MTENQEKTVPKRTKKFIKRGISVILMIGVLIAAMLEVLTLTEYRPPEREQVAINNFGWESAKPGDSLKVLSWQIGFAAGGGKAADEESVRSNLSGIARETAQLDPDVVFLQEVDRDATRSHRIDEMIELVNVFIDDHELDFTSAFAYNRSVLFVPYPIPPTGLVRSGLLTLTRKQMESAERIQLPNADKWPARLVGFKHCLLVERLPVQNSDRELVLINFQTDAGSSSQGKSEQEKAILGFLQEEADKGNYVIAAGEFDQTFSDADGSLLKYYPEGGCVLSSNIEVRSCERKKTGSEYAGHEPVLLECVLR